MDLSDDGLKDAAEDAPLNLAGLTRLLCDVRDAAREESGREIAYLREIARATQETAFARSERIRELEGGAAQCKQLRRRDQGRRLAMTSTEDTRQALLDAAMGATRLVTARADWKAFPHGGGVILSADEETVRRAKGNGWLLGLAYRNLLDATEVLPESRVATEARDAAIAHWRLRAEASEQRERERETVARVYGDRRAHR